LTIAPTTLYAARGRLIPFNSNSPTGSTLTAFSTFVILAALIANGRIGYRRRLQFAGSTIQGGHSDQLNRVLRTHEADLKVAGIFDGYFCGAKITSAVIRISPINGAKGDQLNHIGIGGLLGVTFG
jgi:hypothetical protein